MSVFRSTFCFVNVTRGVYTFTFILNYACLTLSNVCWFQHFSEMSPYRTALLHTVAQASAIWATPASWTPFSSPWGKSDPEPRPAGCVCVCEELEWLSALCGQWAGWSRAWWEARWRIRPSARSPQLNLTLANPQREAHAKYHKSLVLLWTSEGKLCTSSSFIRCLIVPMDFVKLQNDKRLLQKQIYYSFIDSVIIIF